MNKLFLICMLGLLSRVAWSQDKSDSKSIWNFTVVDSVNKKSLTAVTITSGQNSFITDSDGKVGIRKSFLSMNKFIKFSSIGYKTLSYLQTGQFPDTITLSPSIQILKEVVIAPDVPKKLVFGNVNDSYKGGYLPGPDQEIAEYFPNKDKITGTITSVEFMLLDGHKGIKRPFGVHLYRKSKISIYPQEDLLRDSVIVYNPKGLSMVSVDLSKYDIQLPEDGFFISLQTLPAIWYGKDMIQINGHEFYKVPGIKGVFKDGKFKFDEQIIPGVKYALMRTYFEGMNWKKFEYGTDFAIGATISK